MHTIIILKENMEKKYSFILEIETEDVCKDIASDVEKWFDMSNYSSSHSSGVKIKALKVLMETFFRIMTLHYIPEA